MPAGFALMNLIAGDLALSTYLCTNSVYSCEEHAFYGQGDGQANLYHLRMRYKPIY